MKSKLIYTLALLFATLQTFAQTYTYDNNYRLTKVVYPNGVTVTYSYDALGNRLSKTVTGATAATYTISTSVSPAGSGTVTGGGTYSKGTSIELNAIPNAGYEFLNWSDGITTNPRTLTVTADQSFTAQFKESAVTPDLWGDIVVDGKINNQDLNALVDAYLAEASATDVTDLDSDGSLSIADIAQLVGAMNDAGCPFNNNGHRYVDLGLPSGTLWATCNIGATKPEEFGGYYAWGETENKDTYSWETYKWCDGTTPKSTNFSLTKYCDRGGYGTMDGKLSLELGDDVANVKWGGDWHVPTPDELLELINNCKSNWTTVNGVKGRTFTGPNGNSIFMPAAGYMKNSKLYTEVGSYWSTDICGHSNNARQMEFYNSGIGINEGELETAIRYSGLTVRPVLSNYTPATHNINAPSNYRNHALVDLGLPSGTLWATCNLGASSPEGYGCYYSWGETAGSCDGKSAFGIDTYPVDMTETVEDYGSLDSQYDAASKKWGGEWRTPTLSELKELIKSYYTTCEWTTLNGVNGYRITSIVKGFEGNSIFLPAAGNYWDSTLRYAGEKGAYWSRTLSGTHDVSNNAGRLYFNSSTINSDGEMPWYGLTIRPVVSIDAINQ